MSLFSERLKTRRDKLNLGQEELANESGVSARSISDYERAKSEPSMEQLVKLATALRVPTDWLLGAAQYPAHLPQHETIQDTASTEMLQATLTSLRSQAQSMVAQIDLLQKQTRPKPSSTEGLSDAQALVKRSGEKYDADQKKESVP